MKPLVFLLCSLFISLKIFSQKNDILPKDKTIFDLIADSLSLNNASSTLRPTDSLFSKNWSTTLFNPFKKEKISFPFKIAFTDSSFTSPIPRKTVITSRYGWRNRRYHKGIDIDLITGDDVMSLFDGIVRYKSYHAGHGKTIVIRHHNGLETVYAHLSKYLVKVNDTIKKGQVIGKGGSTGHSTGSHLHLEVSYKGTQINPEYLFDFGENNKIREQHVWVTKNWTSPYLHSSNRQSKIICFTNLEQALESQKKQRQVYTIKQGDTLSLISNKHNIPIRQICKINKISKTSILKIGQKLVLIN